MTHVNNAKGAESAAAEEEAERQLAPAAGRSSVYRFLNAESSSSNNSNSAASQVDAVDSVDKTTTNCLEECHFAACQTRAANWHEEFCITDDELEYEDELLFSTTTPSSSTAAATPALECAAAPLLLGEQQNEQLLMEGILACCCCYVNYATHWSGNLDTRERENSIDSYVAALANDRTISR